MTAKVKIKKVITVCLLSENLADSKDKFGPQAESAFPDGPHLTVFLDENNKLAGIGVNEFKLASKKSSVTRSELERFSPFVNAEESLAWFFSEDDVTDSCRPESVKDLSVGFTWTGDATVLESALRDEDEDEWESELQTFYELLESSDTVAVGWKYVRECDWVVESDESLTEEYGNANWDVLGEGCFVIVRY
jgi:hypothetical protein